MAWRPAASLTTLLKEVNAMAPGRSKASDGTLGDQAHAARCSRHNPNNAGVVCAMDITHDPAGGCDIHAIAESMRTNPNRHPELEYIISRSRIASKSSGWAWKAYSGTNPHDKHVHFAVGQGPDCEPTPPYDSTQSWNLAGEVDDVSKEDVKLALDEEAREVFGVADYTVYITTLLATARDANKNATSATSTALIAVAEVRELKAEVAKLAAAQAPAIDYDKLGVAIVKAILASP